jgi:hypothetical protein
MLEKDCLKEWNSSVRKNKRNKPNITSCVEKVNEFDNST